MTDDELIKELLDLLPISQKERVFKQDLCDIGHGFLGFIEIYKTLSQIIPKHFTIIDLGCAYNPQCFYFLEHKKYVAVDYSKIKKFQSNNCEIFIKSISSFIKENLDNYNLDETFAICSYVPPWGDDNGQLVRNAFKNVFVYYPHGGFDHIVKFKK